MFSNMRGELEASPLSSYAGPQEGKGGEDGERSSGGEKKGV